MNSKTIDFGIVLLIRNHAIFVILSTILVSTAVASSQMASAKNTTASTLPFASTQRLPLAASSNPNQANTSSLSSLSQSATTIRIFNIYTTHVTGFNEIKGVQKANLTDDQYSLQTLLVNQGDKIVVNLYNMEAPSGDRHSFTIDAPYNVNIDTAQGGNGTAAFVADHVGIFKFYCKYHIPSMVGELVILPSRM
jgi:nitrous oxide reductase